MKRSLYLLFLFLCLVLPAHSVSAACSAYAGMASLNEFFKDRANQALDNDDFVEVKILNGLITASTFNNWTIQVCEQNLAGNNNDADGCSGAISLSTFNDKTPPWIVLKGNIGRYINFKTGFDAILLDASGDVIDYLSVDSYAPQQQSSCPGTSLPFDTTASAPGASDKFIFRSPDGTGNWDDAPSASAPPTEDDTNDEDPSGNPAVTISVANVTVTKGQTATFNLTIPATQTYPISVTYTTQNASATAGTDYTSTSGTATIAAGSTTTSINVATIASSPSASGVFFYLYLSSPVNATLANHYPTGTIQGAGLHHIEISHDGMGLTCEAESITLRACANATCSSLYGNDVSVNLQPTGWVGGDTQTISAGSSSFNLSKTTADTYTLAISTSTPSASNAVECINTGAANSSCDIIFYNTGFIYTIPTQTSCTTSTPITISAVRLDNTSQACIPTFVGQTRNVDFSLAYSTPNTGSRAVSLNYNSVNYTPIDNSNTQTVPIDFDSNGQSSFTVTYPDAGQITLNSVYTGSTGTADAGLSMLGSATFVTKPAKLFVYASEANSDCLGSIATCSAFKRAGDTFDLNIRAACSDNSVTPNFQLSGITLSHLNTAPAISQGLLGTSNFDMLASDNGEHLVSQTVSEVGAYSFTASLPAGGYFGQSIGDATLNTSTEIGRFYPDHFCVSANSILNRTDTFSATSCSDSFSYLDEDFDARLTLTAQALGAICTDASVTQNYHAAWSKFTTPFSEDTTDATELGKWNFAAVNEPSGTAAVLNSRLALNSAASSPTEFTNGQAVLAARLHIARSGSAPAYTAEPPYTDVHIGINPIDTDNVTLDSTDLSIAADNYRDVGTTALYFGRLLAENAYGTNQTDVGLDMYARTEFCNSVTGGVCTEWLTKTDDSCTLYNINPPAGVALGANPSSIGTAGYYARASATVTSSIFTFDDDGLANSYARVHVPDTNNHSAGWRLFYTTGGDGGDFSIPFSFPFNSDSSVHPYLLHQDGIASFGQFRGDDRIIFWREILE